MAESTMPTTVRDVLVTPSTTSKEVAYSCVEISNLDPHREPYDS